MKISIQKLKTLRESEDHVEFKEAKHEYPFAGGKRTEPKERRRCVLGYIVALANEKGGMLVLGMADKQPHAVVGSDFAQGEIGALEDEIYKRLGIRVKFEELFESDRRVLVITVPSRPIGRLLKFEGVALMRTGESLREMSDTEMFGILSEQEPDFSAKPCDGLRIKDLSSAAIDLMRRKYAAKQNNKLFLTQSPKQLLSDLELIVDGKLNYAALILLGSPEAIHKYLPQNNIVVEYRKNASMIEYSARKEFQQPLFVAIDSVWEYLNQPICNPLQHYQDGPYIFDIPTFNEVAVREALLNAVCHRSYSVNSDLVVKQSPESLSITNAGGFPIGVDLSNLLTVNSIPRNKRLCEVLQKTGLIERSGQGVDKMFFQCIMDGASLPNYSDSDAFQVSVIFGAGVENWPFLYFIRKVQDQFDDSKGLSIQELIELHRVCVLGKSQSGDVVESLLRKGLVVRDLLGVGPTREYLQLKQRLVGGQTGGQTGGQVSVQIEEPTVEKIFEAVKNSPKITRKQLSQKLGIAASAVQKHIDNLKKQQRIIREGGAYGGYWKILKEK